MKPTVFISHSSVDHSRYLELKQQIEKSGVRVWSERAEMGAGCELASGLQDAISKCDLCVFLATSNSIASVWCHAEVGAFWGAGKKTIVLRSEDELEERRLPPQTHGRVWAKTSDEVVDAVRQYANTRILEEVKKHHVDPWKLIDQLPEAIFVKDVNGNYVYFNKTFTDMFGLNDAEATLVRRTDPEAFGQTDQSYHFVLTDNKAFRQLSPVALFEYITHYNRTDEEPKPYYTVKRSVKGRGGNQYVLGTCIDVGSVIASFSKNIGAYNEREYEEARKRFDSSISHGD